MGLRINIRDVINELQSLPMIQWYKEQDYICIDTSTRNYDITLCKHSGPEEGKISYYIHSSEGYIEDFVTVESDYLLHKTLLDFYEKGLQNIKIINTA